MSVKTDQYRDLPPCRELPSGSISIPVYRSTDDQKRLYAQIVAQRAKDVTPKGDMQ